MCEQMGLSPQGLLEFLQARVRVGAVTLGERGMLWYGEDGKIRELASLVPAERIVDSGRRSTAPMSGRT